MSGLTGAGWPGHGRPAAQTRAAQAQIILAMCKNPVVAVIPRSFESAATFAGGIVFGVLASVSTYPPQAISWGFPGRRPKGGVGATRGKHYTQKHGGMKMLSEKILKLLNEQIGHEFYSANLYLAMSSWAGAKALRGSAAFLEQHCDEEMRHMRKLFAYLNDTGAQAVVPELPKPPVDFASIKDVFAKTLEHEIFITKKINSLVDACLQEKDYATFNFLQWYVAEQHEEEMLFRSILDLMDLAGTEGRGLFLVDKEIGKMARSKES